MSGRSLGLTIVGIVLLGLGAVGAVLPVMPTTPFVIASAVCLTSGNKKLSDKLEKSRLFGEFIKNHKQKTGISLKTKLFSIAFLWVGLGISMAMLKKPVFYILLTVVGICVTIHIALIKTKDCTNADEDCTRN